MVVAETSKGILLRGESQLTKKCPYCAGSVRDEARACRHCNRDFTIVASLQDELSSEREELRKKDAQIAAKDEQIVNMGAYTRWDLIWLATLLAPVVSISSNLTINGLDYSGFLAQVNERADTLLALAVSDLTSVLSVIYLLAPLPFGFWVAHMWPGRRTWPYIILGLVVGAIALLMQWIVEALLQKALAVASPEDYLRGLKPLYSFWAFFATPALVFVTGALFGHYQKVKSYPESLRKSGLAWNIAQKIPRVEASAVVDSVRLSGPLIAAILGIFSALIGLVAALIRLL